MIDSELKTFRHFLLRWQLGRLFMLGVEESATSAFDCVIENHLFSGEIDQIEFGRLAKWRENRNIVGTSLHESAIIRSRVLDTITSELLANASEWGLSGRTSSYCYIMAKLLKPISMEKALQIHQEFPHLSRLQERHYRYLSQNNIDTLEIIVADTGTGFGGNQALKRIWDEHQKPTANEFSEANAILFALRPEVSTRGDTMATVAQWEAFADNTTGGLSVDHGLSEVSNIVREHGGFWRIHSNSTIVEQDCVTGNGSYVHSVGADANGCVHHLLIPTFNKHFRTSTKAPPKSSCRAIPVCIGPLDRSDSAEPITLPELAKKAARELHYRIVQFALKEPGVPLLVNLSPLCDTPQPLIRLYLSFMLKAIVHVRQYSGVYICGADSMIKSELRRFIHGSRSAFPNLITPLLQIFPGKDAWVGSTCNTLDLPEDIMRILDSALDPLVDDGILLSDCDQNTRAILESLQKANPHLLIIREINKVDQEIGGALKVSSRDGWGVSQLLGAMPYKHFIGELQRSKSIRKGNYLHLEKLYTEYIYVGKLWPKSNILPTINLWATLAVEFLSSDHTTDTELAVTDEVCILALLHPAIELAHAIVRFNTGRRLRLTEISRVSEMRWDSDPIAKLSPQIPIVILTDIVDEGSLLSRVFAALQVLEIRVLGVVCILDLGTKREQQMRILSFSRTNAD